MKLIDGFGQLLSEAGDIVGACEYHETWEGEQLVEGYLTCHGRREDYPRGVYRLRRPSGEEQPIRIEEYPAWVESDEMPSVTIAFTALVPQVVRA